MLNRQVNRDKQWKSAPRSGPKQSSQQCPKVLVMFGPTTTTGRYLSCDDSRSQPGDITFVTATSSEMSVDVTHSLFRNNINISFF